MPYFKEFNILFIHIPKTGGSNIENFFLNYSKNKPTINHLLSNNLNIRINNHSLQHMTYQEYFNNKDYFNIDTDSLKIITVVRNPYDRIISDLFYLKFADPSYNREQIEETLKNYLYSNHMYDNHKLEQYKFIIDNENKINKKIIILKCENLNEQMKILGFPEFEKFCNYTNNNFNKNYLKFLNDNSISLINNYYNLDFEYFNYQKL